MANILDIFRLPKMPQYNGVSKTTPMVANRPPVLPATPSMNNSQSSSTALVPGQFGQPVIPMVKPSAVSSPVIQTVPSATPTKPVTTTSAPASTTSTSTPPPSTPPAVPTPIEKAQGVVTEAEKQYKQDLGFSSDYLGTQESLDRLIEGTKAGYTGTQNQAIPLEFITGQLSAIERRSNTLAEPLIRKMARLEASRQSALEASKFALERADKNLANIKGLETKTATEKYGTGILGEYEYAKAHGYKGSFEQYQNEDANRKKSVTNVFSGGGSSPEAESWAKLIQSGQATMSNVPAALKTAVATAMGTMTGDTSKALDQITLMKGALDRAEKVAGASGRSGVRRAVEGALVGNTDYTNLVAETNTIRTNVLTMMTDPAVKKFFGPQMSNADVQLMTAAGTTINPELQSPESMKNELSRLKDLMNRMESAVRKGSGTTSSGAGSGDADYDAYLKAIGQ